MAQGHVLVSNRRSRLRTRAFALCVAAAAALGLWLLLSHVQSHRGATAIAGSVCQSSQLSARVGFSGVAAGHEGTSIYLANKSGSSCRLDGYPTLQMLTAAGRRIPTHTSRAASYIIPAMKPHRVLLSPRHSGTFFMAITDTGIPDAVGKIHQCPVSSRVAITLPGNRSAITIDLRTAPYGGSIPRLRCGVISVSPVIGGIHRRV